MVIKVVVVEERVVVIGTTVVVEGTVVMVIGTVVVVGGYNIYSKIIDESITTTATTTSS